MGKQKILDSRKEFLLNMLQGAGFYPEVDIKWTEIEIDFLLKEKPKTVIRGTLFTLQHTSSEYFFSFQRATGRDPFGHVKYSPGDTKLTVTGQTDVLEWSALVISFKNWVSYLRREIDAKSRLAVQDSLRRYVYGEDDLLDRPVNPSELEAVANLLRAKVKPFLMEKAAQLASESEGHERRPLLKRYLESPEELEGFLDAEIERVNSDIKKQKTLGGVLYPVIGLIAVLALGFDIHILKLLTFFSGVITISNWTEKLGQR